MRTKRSGPGLLTLSRGVGLQTPAVSFRSAGRAQAFFSSGCPGEFNPKRCSLPAILVRSASVEAAAWRFFSLAIFSVRVRRRRISGLRLGADIESPDFVNREPVYINVSSFGGSDPQAGSPALWVIHLIALACLEREQGKGATSVVPPELLNGAVSATEVRSRTASSRPSAGIFRVGGGGIEELKWSGNLRQYRMAVLKEGYAQAPSTAHSSLF